MENLLQTEVLVYFIKVILLLETEHESDFEQNFLFLWRDPCSPPTMGGCGSAQRDDPQVDEMIHALDEIAQMITRYTVLHTHGCCDAIAQPVPTCDFVNIRFDTHTRTHCEALWVNTTRTSSTCCYTSLVIS